MGRVEEGVGQRAGRPGGAHGQHPLGDEPGVVGLGDVQPDVGRFGRGEPDDAQPLAHTERGRVGGHRAVLAAQHPGASQQPHLQPAAGAQLAGQGHRVPGVLERRVEVVEGRAFGLGRGRCALG